MKGVYLAFFRLEEDRRIKIGAVGEMEFEAGLYAYVGSAMNSAEKRIGRHFSEVENTHWHIDYFSAVAEPADYLIVPEESRFECVLADAVSEIGAAVDGFGSSDCRCSSHLFRVS